MENYFDYRTIFPDLTIEEALQYCKVQKIYTEKFLSTFGEILNILNHFSKAEESISTETEFRTENCALHNGFFTSVAKNGWFITFSIHTFIGCKFMHGKLENKYLFQLILDEYFLGQRKNTIKKYSEHFKNMDYHLGELAYNSNPRKHEFRNFNVSDWGDNTLYTHGKLIKRTKTAPIDLSYSTEYEKFNIDLEYSPSERLINDLMYIKTPEKIEFRDNYTHFFSSIHNPAQLDEMIADLDDIVSSTLDFFVQYTKHINRV